MENDVRQVLEEQKAKIAVLELRPKIEQSYKLSKDKQYIIHETRIVDIKPIKYMNKVLEGNPKEEYVQN